MENINLTMNESGGFNLNKIDCGRVDEYKAKCLNITLNSLFRNSRITYLTMSFEPYGIGRKIVSDNIYKDISYQTGDIFYSMGEINCPLHDYMVSAPGVSVQIDGYETDSNGDIVCIIKSGIFEMSFSPSLMGKPLAVSTMEPDLKLSERIETAIDDYCNVMQIGENQIKNNSVSTAKIKNSAVTTEKISNNSVTSDKLCNNSVTAGKIASGSITAEKIQPGSVSGNIIADNGVTSDKLADYSVGENKISNYSITSEKIANGNVLTSKLANSAVTEEKIADGAVRTSAIYQGSVTNGKLAEKSVTASKLADNAVTRVKIADGSVNGEKLADGCITEGKIADLSVTNGKISNNSVSGEKIQSGAVSTAKLQNGSVTPEKLDRAYLTAHQDISGKADIDSLSEVSFSGSYNDLTDKPNALTEENLNKLNDAYSHSLSSHAPSNAEENLIESVILNGRTMTISNKTVSLSVLDAMIYEVITMEVTE